MSDKNNNLQKHGTGTAEFEQENKGGQQQKDQGKTGQHGGSNPQNHNPQNQQHDQGKRDQSKGTPHNK